jgi:hypothetical protein
VSLQRIKDTTSKKKVALNSQELERRALNIGEQNQKNKEKKLRNNQSLERER